MTPITPRLRLRRLVHLAWPIDSAAALDREDDGAMEDDGVGERSGRGSGSVMYGLLPLVGDMGNLNALDSPFQRFELRKTFKFLQETGIHWSMRDYRQILPKSPCLHNRQALKLASVKEFGRTTFSCEA